MIGRRGAFSECFVVALKLTLKKPLKKPFKKPLKKPLKKPFKKPLTLFGADRSVKFSAGSRARFDVRGR